VRSLIMSFWRERIAVEEVCGTTRMVHIVLDDQVAARLAAVQDYLGLTKGSEAVRSLITAFWREHIDEKEVRE